MKIGEDEMEGLIDPPLLERQPQAQDTLDNL